MFERFRKKEGLHPERIETNVIDFKVRAAESLFPEIVSPSKFAGAMLEHSLGTLRLYQKVCKDVDNAEREFGRISKSINEQKESLIKEALGNAGPLSIWTKGIAQIITVHQAKMEVIRANDSNFSKAQACREMEVELDRASEELRKANERFASKFPKEQSLRESYFRIAKSMQNLFVLAKHSWAELSKRHQEFEHTMNGIESKKSAVLELSLKLSHIKEEEKEPEQVKSARERLKALDKQYLNAKTKFSSAENYINDLFGPIKPAAKQYAHNDTGRKNTVDMLSDIPSLLVNFSKLSDELGYIRNAMRRGEINLKKEKLDRAMIRINMVLDGSKFREIRTHIKSYEGLSAYLKGKEEEIERFNLIVSSHESRIESERMDRSRMQSEIEKLNAEIDKLKADAIEFAPKTYGVQIEFRGIQVKAVRLGLNP